eukprot:1350637-Lingulodinium_polyedra.AAC.1
MMREFDKMGFSLHDITGVETVAKVLGFLIGQGRPGSLRPAPERVWKLRSALQWLEERPFITGEQLGVFLG